MVRGLLDLQEPRQPAARSILDASFLGPASEDSLVGRAVATVEMEEQSAPRTGEAAESAYLLAVRSSAERNVATSRLKMMSQKRRSFGLD